MQKAEIYYPLCKWKPPGLPLWECLEVCGNVWDTFATGGVCPKCSEKFEFTQCIRCHKLSPHKDWYHYPKKPPKELIEKLRNKEKNSDTKEKVADKEVVNV